MTKSKEVRPLQVGERVRVYDTYVQVGEIDAINTSGNIRIKSGSAWYHPKQCRRLIKKPRPKPQERTEATVIVCGEEFQMISLTVGCRAIRESVTFDARHPANRFRLIELRPGEIPVSRDDLAKAWDNEVFPELLNSENSWTFPAFCAALDLPEAK